MVTLPKHDFNDLECDANLHCYMSFYYDRDLTTREKLEHDLFQVLKFSQATQRTIRLCVEDKNYDYNKTAQYIYTIIAASSVFIDDDDGFDKWSQVKGTWLYGEGRLPFMKAFSSAADKQDLWRDSLAKDLAVKLAAVVREKMPSSKPAPQTKEVTP